MPGCPYHGVAPDGVKKLRRVRPNISKAVKVSAPKRADAAQGDPEQWPRLIASTTLSWVPTAKKNRNRVTARGPRCPSCGRAKWVGIRPSAQAEADEEALGLVAASLAARSTPAHPDHAVRLQVTYQVGKSPSADRVLIEVWDLGPDPGPRRARTRDLDNLVQGIADAFQGHLYANDKQLSELNVRRQEETPHGQTT